MEILLWLAPAAVVTVLAMCWAGWAGRERPEPDREVLLQTIRDKRGKYGVTSGRSS